jgi:TetR/AcrR family transcriptional repressor of nem operon
MLTTNHPRERLIKTAANLVHKQGWTATGINQILSDAGIPKGSFYYYFRSKEALGVAVLQHHHNELEQFLARTLTNPTLSTERALSAYISELATTHAATGYRLGCPIGTLASEIASQSSPLLDEANKALSLYESAWAEFIRRGQAEGSISAKFDPIEGARFASMMLQGAMLAMKCAGHGSALEQLHAILSSHFMKEKSYSTISAPTATIGAVAKDQRMSEMPQALAS